jgi:hypothetical protein
MGEIDVRWPLALRIAGVLCGVAWAGSIIHDLFTGAVSGGGPLAIVLALANLAGAVFAIWRVPFARLRADGHEIFVRNYFMTYRVPVWQVLGTDIGGTTVRGFRTVRLLTGTGRIPVDALILRNLGEHQQRIDDWIIQAKELSVTDPGDSRPIG